MAHSSEMRLLFTRDKADPISFAIEKARQEPKLSLVQEGHGYGAAGHPNARHGISQNAKNIPVNHGAVCCGFQIRPYDN